MTHLHDPQHVAGFFEFENSIVVREVSRMENFGRATRGTGFREARHREERVENDEELEDMIAVLPRPETRLRHRDRSTYSAPLNSQRKQHRKFRRRVSSLTEFNKVVSIPGESQPRSGNVTLVE